MKKIAVYGKGGIGKSTISCNVSAALAAKGLRVLQIGCDPKADSTALLHGGRRIPTVLETERQAGSSLTLEDIVYQGENGVLCAEAGGPLPGVGCAGRGIINALETLKRLKAYEIYQPDLVIYDVLGDVVCGGFSMPMRSGYADKVFIVTSGEKMAKYAAGNICMAVRNFQSRGYASLGGLILNRRGAEHEDTAVQQLADDFDTDIIGTLDYSADIAAAEKHDCTVAKLFPESPAVKQFDAISEALLTAFGNRL